MTWTTTDKYGSYTAQGSDGNTYTWNNDCWSPDAGPQTLWVNSNNTWGVRSSQVFNTNDWVETYPHIGWAGGKLLSSYPTIRAQWAEQGPGYASSLRWEAAFDIWLNNGHRPGKDQGYEIMVWVDTSNVSPDGYQGLIAIDGISYKHYEATGGNGPASWFVRLTNEPAGSINLKNIIAWVAAHGRNYAGEPANPEVDTIEFGWEVWGTGGVPVNFSCSKYAMEFA